MFTLIMRKIVTCLAIMLGLLVLSTCTQPSYASSAHPHGESGLVTRSTQDAQAVFKTALCCVSFGYAPVMARLEGDTFACAGFPCVPVYQPTSVLPPSLGNERQDFLHTQGVSHD